MIKITHEQGAGFASVTFVQGQENSTLVCTVTKYSKGQIASGGITRHGWEEDGYECQYSPTGYCDTGYVEARAKLLTGCWPLWESIVRVLRKGKFKFSRFDEDLVFQAVRTLERTEI